MYHRTDFPALRAEDLMYAQLFASREEMVSALYGDVGGFIAELGVAVGYFSRFLLETLKPDKFVGLDLFDLHDQETIWGRPSSELLEGKTHKQFYSDLLRGWPTETDLIEGYSHLALNNLEDASYDMIYIDASHTYEDVQRDCEAALRKLKRSGLLVFNDYIMFDHHNGVPYGVVQVVNELVTSSNWKVVGFALNQQMYCDIALRRITLPITSRPR